MMIRSESIIAFCFPHPSSHVRLDTFPSFRPFPQPSLVTPLASFSARCRYEISTLVSSDVRMIKTTFRSKLYPILRLHPVHICRPATNSAVLPHDDSTLSTLHNALTRAQYPLHLGEVMLRPIPLHSAIVLSRATLVFTMAISSTLR